MIKIVSLLLSCIISISALAQDGESKGINFFKGAFNQALEQAKSQDKLIFIDFYSDWCGPCKGMADMEFTQESVGTFFNENFINLKVNAEKGSGLELKRRYDIVGYPTLMFINSKGYVIHVVGGARKAEELIALGREALAKKGEKGVEELYAEGNRDPKVVDEYLKNLMRTGQITSLQRVINQLFLEQGGDIFFQPLYWEVFDGSVIDTELPISIYFTKNYKKLSKKIGNYPVLAKLRHLYVSIEASMRLYESDAMSGYREVKHYKLDKIKYQHHIQQMRSYNLPEVESLIAELNFIFDIRRGDTDKALEAVAPFVKKASPERLYFFSVVGERLMKGETGRSEILLWAKRAQNGIKDEDMQRELSSVIKSLELSPKAPEFGVRRRDIKQCGF